MVWGHVTLCKAFPNDGRNQAAPVCLALTFLKTDHSYFYFFKLLLDVSHKVVSVLSSSFANGLKWTPAGLVKGSLHPKHEGSWLCGTDLWKALVWRGHSTRQSLSTLEDFVQISFSHWQEFPIFPYFHSSGARPHTWCPLFQCVSCSPSRIALGGFALWRVMFPGKGHCSLLPQHPPMSKPQPNHVLQWHCRYIWQRI